MLEEVSFQTFVSTNAGHTFICININSLLVDYSRFHLVKNEKGSQKSLCITGGPSSKCNELLSLLNLYANVQRVKRDKLPPTSTIT